MKNFLLVLVAVFFMACNNSFPELLPLDQPLDPGVTQENLVTLVGNSMLVPLGGHLQGDVGNFSEVDASAYEIVVDHSSMTIYVSHLEGTVMVRLDPRQNLNSLFQEAPVQLDFTENTRDFFGLVCQSMRMTIWDFDRQVESGTIVVTPTSVNTWLVEFDLQWTANKQILQSVSGFIDVKGR
jgi:hypothetical protein